MEDRYKSLWKFFETTGSIEAYINYVEFRRLVESEFAEEKQRELNGRESNGTGNQGD